MMKINVRKNTFETNSSSMHSLVLTNVNTETTDEEILKFLKHASKTTNNHCYEDICFIKTKEGDTYLYVSGKSFGQEFAFYDKWFDKLLYVIADSHSYADISAISSVVTNRIKQINDPLTNSFKGLIFEYNKPNDGKFLAVDAFGWGNGMQIGNVDHQSSGLAHSAARIINRQREKALFELIFSNRFVVFTDSDGGCYLHDSIRCGTVSTEKFIAEVSEAYARVKENGKYTRDYDHCMPYWRSLKDYLNERDED